MRMNKQKWIGDLILCFCYRNLLPACLPHIINESLSLSSFIHESKRQITQLTPSVMIWCHNPSHNITHTTLRENREAIAKVLEQWNATEGFRLLNCTHVGMLLDTCTEVAILRGRWKMRTCWICCLFSFSNIWPISLFLHHLLDKWPLWPIRWSEPSVDLIVGKLRKYKWGEKRADNTDIPGIHPTLVKNWTNV